MADISETLRQELRDAEYSEGYAESFLDAYVATQIKVLREERELTQEGLAQLLGTKQTVISRIENVNYSSWNITTLKKLARALKVRLRVSFETYGSLVDEVKTFSRESLQRVPRDKDPILHAEVTPESLPSETESAEHFLPEIPQPRNAGNRVVFITHALSVEARRRAAALLENEGRGVKQPRPAVPALAKTEREQYGNISYFAR